MERPERTMGKIDVDRPSSARIYDYFLGGAHNFEVDRIAANELAKVHPAIGVGMRANRSYLRRAVNFLAQSGVDQFLDLGSGIPTVGNVHEIAQRANPAARVAYVDIEPIAVTHSNTILADNERALAIRADLRDADQVLTDPDVTALLDLDRPVALILAGVLQYIADADDPAGMVSRYVDRLAPGSYVAMSHPSTDELTQERAEGANRASSMYDRTETPFHYRTKAEFETFFRGLELVDPGVVHLWDWRPEFGSDVDDVDGQVTGFAGVGRKP
ncbi:MAG TPA: SAM-dependent methyltransferase [Pseudonocardiaceae bacterium]|nr:SAM-dependent methyltransferase [Pseudonocardiaceae bacterium]